MRLTLLLLPLFMQAQPYSAERVTVDNIEVIRLSDAGRHTVVSIVPSLGNNAYSMRVNGKEVFWSPYPSLAGFQQKPVLLGTPLLAPWANRLDGDGFWANGKRYALNPGLGNLRRDGNQLPIHGLLLYAKDWQVVEMKADAAGAQVTSRLEFWRYPDWMAQFPFAHTLEMTYRLSGGTLEVRTAIHNHATEPMPVSIGFHPYYQLPGVPRDQWSVHIAARAQYVLSAKTTPTGETKPVSFPDLLPLAGRSLDDVFGDLPDGSETRLEGGGESIRVRFGPKYPVAVIYSPEGRDFLCIEPMTGPTNAFNMAHDGTYGNLQTIAPGGVWQESYWVTPAGF